MGNKLDVNVSVIITTTILLSTFRMVIGLTNEMHQAYGQADNYTLATGQWPNIMPNVKTFVVSNVTSPQIDDSYV